MISGKASIRIFSDFSSGRGDLPLPITAAGFLLEGSAPCVVRDQHVWSNSESTLPQCSHRNRPEGARAGTGARRGEKGPEKGWGRQE